MLAQLHATLLLLGWHDGASAEQMKVNKPARVLLQLMLVLLAMMSAGHLRWGRLGLVLMKVCCSG